MKSIPILSTLLRNWLPIALVTLLVTAGVYLYSSSRTPVYTATATEYFSLGSATSAADLAQGSNYVQDQMSSYGELATAPVVLNPVIDKLRLPLTYRELSRNVSAVTPRNTVILQISATDASPQLAASIANAVGSELATAVERVSPKAPNGKALVTVQTIQTAVPPTFQSAPNTRLNTALAFGVGLVLGCALALLLRRLDPKINSAGELAKIVPQPPLGAVRHFGKALGPAPALLSPSVGLAAEDVRQLRAAVEEVTADRVPAVIGVTSSIRQEGRSTIALNLALALAEAGHRTVLVDTDLRSTPSLAPEAADHGLLSVLAERDTVEHVLRRYPNSTLDVLPAGGVHENPTEVLTSSRMSATVAALRRDYRYIVFDAPALEVSDTLSLRPLLDDVVLVVRVAKVRSEQLEHALMVAQASGLPVTGVVLNDVRERRALTRSNASYLDRPWELQSDTRTVARSETEAPAPAERHADSRAG